MDEPRCDQPGHAHDAAADAAAAAAGTGDGRRRRGIGPRGLVAGAAGAAGVRPGLGRIVALYYIPGIHFVPYSLTYPVPLFLKRQCDRTPGPPSPWRRRRGCQARPSRSRACSTRRSGPARGGCAASSFSAVNRLSMALLYGPAGRLTCNNGGSRPGGQDGNWYTRAEFWSNYGGTAEWEAVLPSRAQRPSNCSQDSCSTSADGNRSPHLFQRPPRRRAAA
jgi:hypothetical protein